MPGRWSPPTCSDGSNHLIRVHATVNQSVHDQARDDDGDGMREVHGNMAEGVHQNHLAGDWAMGEVRRKLKRVSPAFLSSLVTCHPVCM